MKAKRATDLRKQAADRTCQVRLPGCQHSPTVLAHVRLSGISGMGLKAPRPARRLDDDNLASGFKGIRDGVADALGTDDRNPRVTWRYAQQRGEPHEYAMTITITPKE